MRRSKSIYKALLIAASLVFIVLPAFSQTKTDISGSEWVGLDDDDVTTFVFEKGGILSYAYSGNSYRNGTWSQDGSRVTFEMNKNYRSFIGTISGDTITGSSENTAGLKWEMTIYRYRPPQCSNGKPLLSEPCTAPLPIRTVVQPKSVNRDMSKRTTTQKRP